MTGYGEVGGPPGQAPVVNESAHYHVAYGGPAHGGSTYRDSSDGDWVTAPTGHPAIDAAARDLAGLRGASPAEQLPAFQAVHRSLQEALASIDQQ